LLVSPNPPRWSRSIAHYLSRLTSDHTRRYLEILAIQPEYQGKRLGPRLLDHHLALIDDATSELASAPAWLESSPEAERLYRSRGFEDVGKVRAEGWGEGFPAMLRPRSGGE